MFFGFKDLLTWNVLLYDSFLYSYTVQIYYKIFVL